MITAYQLGIVAAGVFFLNGLLTGVWKFRAMAASPEGLAHPYVDIAHRASLLYSFAALLLATFAQISQLPATVELVAIGLPLAYFAIAIVGYMVQGYRKETDNQFRDTSTSLAIATWSLVVAEIGGFIVLFYGVLLAIGA
ncbi:MAG: hypothetical protein R3228_17460 [Halioglobus sp.]|nr:hypothetical protein [Halioglobus sp.]